MTTYSSTSIYTTNANDIDWVYDDQTYTYDSTWRWYKTHLPDVPMAKCIGDDPIRSGYVYVELGGPRQEEKKEEEYGMLYEVAILETPTKREADKGKLATLVFGPKCVVAKDEDTAKVIAAREAPELNPERTKILVRRFA